MGLCIIEAVRKASAVTPPDSDDRRIVLISATLA